MAKTAVMVRLSEGELSALDSLALKNGISRATCATSILRQRLGAAVVKQTAAEPDGKASACKAGEPGSTPGAASTYRKSPDDCAHPFRDPQNRCRVCGHQR